LSQVPGEDVALVRCPLASSKCGECGEHDKLQAMRLGALSNARWCFSICPTVGHQTAVASLGCSPAQFCGPQNLPWWLKSASLTWRPYVGQGELKAGRASYA